jgi:hypothetical protein
MKTIDLSEVAALAPYLQSGAEPVVLIQDGRTVGAIVPATDDDVESMLLSINPRFEAILLRSQERLESEGGVSSAEARRRLGLPDIGSSTKS